MEGGIEVLEDMLAIETLESQLSQLERTKKESSIAKKVRQRLEAYYEKVYGKEGNQRLKLLEQMIRGHVDRWQREMPYIGFDLFLVMNDENEEVDRRDVDQLWSLLFPLSAPSE